MVRYRPSGVYKSAEWQYLLRSLSLSDFSRVALPLCDWKHKLAAAANLCFQSHDAPILPSLPLFLSGTASLDGQELLPSRARRSLPFCFLGSPSQDLKHRLAKTAIRCFKSQRLQPIKNVDIPAPGGAAAGLIPYRIGFCKGGSLHPQVNGCIDLICCST